MLFLNPLVNFLQTIPNCILEYSVGLQQEDQSTRARQLGRQAWVSDAYDSTGR